MRILLAAALLPLLALACSSASVSGGDGVPVLVNRTGGALLYAAFDLSAAALVDPQPALDPAEAQDRLVAAGEEQPLRIDGYEEGVLLFIYEVPAADRAGPVPLSRTVRVTREELLRMNNRIVLEGR